MTKGCAFRAGFRAAFRKARTTSGSTEVTADKTKDEKRRGEERRGKKRKEKKRKQLHLRLVGMGLCGHDARVGCAFPTNVPEALICSAEAAAERLGNREGRSDQGAAGLGRRTMRRRTYDDAGQTHGSHPNLEDAMRRLPRSLGWTRSARRGRDAKTEPRNAPHPAGVRIPEEDRPKRRKRTTQSPRAAN